MSRTDAPVPNDRCEYYPAVDNRRRSRIVSGLLVLWIAVSLIIDFLHYLPRGAYYYLYLDLIILPLIAGFGVVVWSGPGSARRIRVVVFLFSLAFLATFQETPYTLFIVAFFVSTSLLIPPKESVLIYTGAFVAYAVALTALGGSPVAHGITVFIEVFVMKVVAGVVSILLYRQRVQTLQAETRLLQQNRSQEQEIANRTEDLNRRLREREVLLREIHHRVKNNLQILASLLKLSEENGSGKDAEARIRGAEQRIASMAMVHQQLDHADDFENVNLGSYLKDLSDYVVDSHRRVFLSVQSHGSELILVVRDNGKGFCPEHVDTTIPAGLGLVLIESLSKQLGGRFAYDCSEGTTFRFELPLERA
ncbi:MAG: sensor histidine kinase [Alkalispirochaeta sp.]